MLRLAQDLAVRERAQEMMDRQLAHMVRLIDDLLDVSRINRNKMELRRARVTLADVVASAVETAQPAIDEAGTTVCHPAHRPVHLDADLTRLAQVFSNLLTNWRSTPSAAARSGCPPSGKTGDIEVTVRDTGIGIPRESLPNIFDMFSQVDRSIERTTGGLGIGLALVKGLVEMHGGTVVAASDGEGQGQHVHRHAADHPGRGTRRRRASHPPLPAPPRAGFSSWTTIGTGPEPRHDARAAGHEVALAHDGVEAVERAEQFRPEVILMDVGMPRLNGFEATRRIRRVVGQGVTIIALTGWGQEGDRDQSREAGCDGHLVKPVALDELHRILG